MPGQHDGRGVVCPNCRRMLRLPGPDETTPPLVVPLQGAATRPRRSDKRSDEFDETFAHKKESPPWLRWAVVASVLTVFGVVGIGWIIGGNDPPAGGEGRPTPPTTADAGAETPKPPAPRTRNIAELEQVIRAFLDAPDPEQLLAQVRHPEITGPRLRAMPGPYSPPGFRSAEWAVEPIEQHGALGIIVETRDFTQSLIWLAEDKGSWKVDWESWIGWCQVPWDSIRREKPAGTFRLRALALPAEYYNFGFTDDSEWLCYRLRHPDSDDMLYGYVRRGTPLGDAFRSLEPGDQPVIIDVRFPDGSPADNQLLIEALVSSSWLEPHPAP